MTSTRSQHIRVSDIRHVLRLLGEIRELPLDSTLRHRHVAARLAGLCEAGVVVVAIARDVLPGKTPRLVTQSDHGWSSPAERGAFYRYYDRKPQSPMHRILVDLARHRGSLATCLREQLMNDDEWYNSYHVMECCRPAGIDHCLLSGWLLPRPGWVLGIGLYRTWGDPRPFGTREWNIVHLVHGELGPMHANDPVFAHAGHTGAGANGGGNGMTRRMRHVLDCLLKGESEKEAAHRLGISVHTVHTYVVQLYKKLGVHSRGELLSRCLTRDDAFASLLHRAAGTSTTLESPAPVHAGET